MLADRVRMSVAKSDSFPDAQGYLYDAGRLSEYWDEFTFNNPNDVNCYKESDNITIQRLGYTFTEGGIITTVPIDFSNINTVKATIRLYNHTGSTGTENLGGIQIVVADPTEYANYGEYEYYCPMEGNIVYGDLTTLSLDVSDITVTQYLRLTLTSMGYPIMLDLEAIIYSVWLE